MHTIYKMNAVDDIFTASLVLLSMLLVIIILFPSKKSTRPNFYFFFSWSESVDNCKIITTAMSCRRN